jgi:hypothetical protein
LAKEAGYRGICSAYGGYNFPGDDPFHLQRFHADPEWIRWINWMTVDPRKIDNTHRFQYTLVESGRQLSAARSSDESPLALHESHLETTENLEVTQGG